MSARRVGDVSTLPETAFGPAALTWWGMTGMMVIEGITLTLVAASYIYLRQDSYAWPPEGTALPSLGLATVNVVIMLVSIVPAWLAAARARARDRAGVILWLAVQTALGVVNTALRLTEFRALNVRFDASGYGSATWAVLVAHTLTMVTDVLDSGGLLLLFALTEPEQKHYVDTTENSLFWYFIVATWLPLYLLVFLYPRL